MSQWVLAVRTGLWAFTTCGAGASLLMEVSEGRLSLPADSAVPVDASPIGWSGIRLPMWGAQDQIFSPQHSPVFLCQVWLWQPKNKTKKKTSLSQNHSSKLSRHKAKCLQWGIAEGDRISSHTARLQWSWDGQWTCDRGVSHATSMCSCILSPSEEVISDLTLGSRAHRNISAEPHLGTQWGKRWQAQ